MRIQFVDVQCLCISVLQVFLNCLCKAHDYEISLVLSLCVTVSLSVKRFINTFCVGFHENLGMSSASYVEQLKIFGGVPQKWTFYVSCDQRQNY